MTPTLTEFQTHLRASALERARDCAAWAAESHMWGLDRPKRAAYWQHSAACWWASAFFWLRMAGP